MHVSILETVPSPLIIQMHVSTERGPGFHPSLKITAFIRQNAVSAPCRSLDSELHRLPTNPAQTGIKSDH